MKQDINEVMKRVEVVKTDLLTSMLENDIEPDEALSLLTSMLVQIYYKFVENNSRENFTDTLGKCYDTYQLIEAEPQGGLQ